MEPQYAILQSAVFERFQNGLSWEALSGKHKVHAGVLSRAYASSVRKYPESQPTQAKDIYLNLLTIGRPPVLTRDEKDVIAQCVLYYADNNIPLTRQGICNLVEDYVSMLPQERQN